MNLRGKIKGRAGLVAALAAVTLASAGIMLTQDSLGDNTKGATAEAAAKASASIDRAKALADEAAQNTARNACRKAVLAQLKSPGSARWADDTVASEGSAGWQVDGEVDAQNGFGALVRLSFTCTVDDKGVANAFVSQRN